MTLFKKKKPLFKNVVVFGSTQRRNDLILDETAKRNDIVFGQRSIQAQTGIFSRSTFDFDIFTENPKKTAQAMEKKMDKQVGFDNFFAKAAEHPGTWKVMGRGIDRRKNTPDDVGYIDYSKTPRPRPKVKKIKGVQYRNLAGELKAKRKSLADKNFKFRHKKDRGDLNRALLFKDVGGF